MNFQGKSEEELNDQDILRRQNMRIAVLSGSDDVGAIDWENRSSEKNDYQGNNDFERQFKALDKTYPNVWRRFVFGTNYFRQNGRRWSFYDVDLVYVSISDADQNPKVLKVAQKILAKVKVPVINRPEHVAGARRDLIAAKLAGTSGAWVPKTSVLKRPQTEMAHRLIEREGMVYPLIVRAIGAHGGRDTAVCQNEGELDEALKDCAGPQYLTEFVDFRSEDGLYRKFRFFKIGNSVVFRHLITADHWSIHSADIDRLMARRPDLIAEEKRLFDEGIDAVYPNIRARMLELMSKTRLDYVGADVGILGDGRIVVFEINPAMNFYPLSTDKNMAYKSACVPPALEAVRVLLESRTGKKLDPR